MESPKTFLASIAPHSAATWHALGAALFPGDVSLETENRVYTFRDGVFVSRATKPERSIEAPASMRGVRLLGFLYDEGGLWSLSPRYRPGAHAVLWKAPAILCDAADAPEAIDPSSFVVTSAATSFTIEARDPSRGEQKKYPSQSGVRARLVARPPVFRRPAPPSMTRLHAEVPRATST